MHAFRRWPLVVVVLLPVVLVLTVVAVSNYRQHAFEASWAGVHDGMSKDQVRQLLGEPNQVYAVAAPVHTNSFLGDLIANGMFDTRREKWAYGDRRVITFESTFPYVHIPLDGLLVPEDGDHVIYFSRDGEVVEKRFPYHRGFGSQR